MMKIKIILFLFFLVNFIQAQSPNILWEKSYGGSNHDEPTSIIATNDGGYAVIGTTSSSDSDITSTHGESDVWFVKIDLYGNIQWQKCFGGTREEGGMSFIQNNDNSYVITGQSLSNNGDLTVHHGDTTTWDFWILKIDSIGNIIWQYSYGGSVNDSPYSLIPTLDGGYAIAGYTKSIDGDITGQHGLNDFWIIKIDSNGNLQWQKAFGGSKNEFAYSIVQNIDGTFMVVGSSNSNDGDVTGIAGNLYDIWLVKLDTGGNLLWEKTYGGTDYDVGSNIKHTYDGHYIISGQTASTNGDVSNNHGGYDYWLIKIDTIGNIIWEKSFGGSDHDYKVCCRPTLDNGFILAGESFSSDGDVTGHHGSITNPEPDYWILKTDSAGNIQWEKSLGGSDSDYALDIIQDNNGKYLTVGGSVSTDGDVTGNHGAGDFWLVKLDNATSIEEYNHSSNFFVFPNPANSLLNLFINKSEQIMIYNLFGEVVFKKTYLFNYSGNEELDISYLSQGIYFIKVGNEVQRFVKQ